jgi:sugar/nucleoside kinase (ribokinase family)
MARFDVTIAGEMNIDLILYGVPEELPRERELLARDMMLGLGGSSVIVAHNLAALGAKVGFISRIGNDSHGQIALNALQAGGVDVSHVRRTDDTQTGVTVVLQRDGWRNMVTYAGTTAELTIADLNLEYLADSRHFHLSSFYLLKNLRPSVPSLFRRLKQTGLTISLDTNDDPEDQWSDGLEEVLKYVDVFLPNQHEAEKISGTTNLDDALAWLTRKVPLVVVKLGAEGAMAQRGDERLRLPAVPVEAVDAVGAGDSFNAGFLSEYIRGASLAVCLRTANLAGALSTTRPGGTEAFRDRSHRERFLQANAMVTT